MSTHHPKTKTKQDKGGQHGNHNKAEEDHNQEAEKKSRAFDQGLSNNSNTQTGTANSGYDEKNPKRPGGKQQLDPKVTNQENDITNSDKQHTWREEPVDEQSGDQSGNSKERTDPEIDSPIPDSERTEKKIPKDSL